MRIGALLGLAAILPATAIAACSSANGGSNFGGGTGGSAGGDLGLGGHGGTSLLDGAVNDGAGGDGCSEAAKLIYVVSESYQLYSFYPPTLAFKLIGNIMCPATFGSTPFSMAVQRNGTAWVLYNDGGIFNVSTANAACTATGYQPNQQGWSTFGMGFVSDTAGSNAETLYVADYNGSGLGRIDLASRTLTKVGPWGGLSGSAELTGTGDARLFGFFQGNPVVVAEIDKSSGGILSQAPQPSVNIGSGWAFAFWGGDFYLFDAPSGTSQVDRYSPATQSTQTIASNLGYVIVGAGVSTCAPTTPPK